MSKINSADEYVQRKSEWGEALEMLRHLALSTGMEETIKWGAPVYTLNGKNVVGLGAFKSYVGLWFFQGALLIDKEGKLMNAQEDKTKALRQWRFQSAEEVRQEREDIQAYLKEAMENQKKGKEIKADREKALVLPDELREAFLADKQLEGAFTLLSPGKQREYTDYIQEAKREETRLKRLEKIRPMVLEGKGLNDRYKK